MAVPEFLLEFNPMLWEADTRREQLDAWISARAEFERRHGWPGGLPARLAQERQAREQGGHHGDHHPGEAEPW